MNNPTPAANPIEKQLWATAEKLRKNIDAAEYKHVALGLVFLKYISDSSQTLREKLRQDPHGDPEERDEYTSKNVFFVPESARWETIQRQAKQPDIGKILDRAMDAVEKENANLKNILPKVFSRGNIAATTLGELIDTFSDIDLDGHAAQTKDIFGSVYEYFLGQFALNEGKKGGQFYTPASVVKLLVEMIEPYQGRVFDPCCGSGGMFVQSEKFIKQHQGRVNDISIFGQESNQTTYRLCRMNLAIRHIEGTQVKWNSDGSFLQNAHPTLKADFILANPPFNDDDWGGAQLENDGRWKYGTPPAGNANFAWIQHFIHHLSPNGVAGFVLSKGSLTSKTSSEGVIRQNIVDAGIVDCVVNLPAKLFLNTGIPACLWFISNKRHGYNGERKRSDQILFIDANQLGHLVTRRNKDFAAADIAKIADTYHNWRNKSGKYADVAGFCASVDLPKVRELGYILSPERYVGLAVQEEEFDFNERIDALKAEFAAQLHQEKAVNKRILTNLARLEHES